ncbi:hypothetical protein TSTA_125070 [Talaromyces stipitatus ATCC 10500]|uniref:Uncharacterized protein n=1 Tax=Talaromyces stipitatus (strain ATCC 10500 / CBS 375.48 / QM 6759 / NRRL 1006) TaxID=441959 RepID=B8MCH3_TALSN|nr:uncharacterized protein TSTA_125070 [Talaromyces stipitatus ATCC 10500]EED18789.1 hypothetical protein TSTA_125070 [Talaromyces stipitatus ATCC 10500]
MHFVILESLVRGYRYSPAFHLGSLPSLLPKKDKARKNRAKSGVKPEEVATDWPKCRIDLRTVE